VVDNRSPVVLKDRLIVNNRDILPSTINVEINSFAPYSKGVIFVSAKKIDEQASFLFDVEKQAVFPITSNIEVENVEKVGEILFATSSGALYSYDIPSTANDVFMSNMTWRHVEVPLNQVTHMSPKTNKMWIQSRKQGCYLDPVTLTFDEVEDIVDGMKRFCGKSGNIELLGSRAMFDSQEISDVYLPVATPEGWEQVRTSDNKRGVLNAKFVDGSVMTHQRY
jgi:hypothetical protein